VAIVVAAAAVAFLAYRALTGEEGPETTATGFVQRWSAGDDAAAARLTDNPRLAAAVLRANRRGLDGASLKATLGKLEESEDAASAKLSLRWQIPGIGRYAYATRIRLRRSAEQWRVRWSPQTVHPKLDAETRLGTTAVPKARGEILDRERRVVIRAGAVPIETLAKRAGRRGRSLTTTLHRRVQAAAEVALAEQTDEAALVAVQPSTGDVLAVANRPVGSSSDRALEGTYAPGSTFKVVSTAALLRAGLDVGDTVRCPPTIEAGGRQFKNFEGGAAGAVPFSRDFAVSCNTAFVSLAPRLAPDALQRTARDYGLGRTLKLALPAAGGRVPPGKDAVERAAAMIGQHEILASPLSMALVAATVADGRWRAPRLLASDPRAAGPALPGPERDALRSLMRLVVTEGSGTALADIPGEVRGKSGTAEFGGGDPPPTHAWFIAFRGDLAVAVLVERGRSGGSVAAPLAARFFSAL
jgi:cell division protein FtsI/penicillin-binding protein 2